MLQSAWDARDQRPLEASCSTFCQHLVQRDQSVEWIEAGQGQFELRDGVEQSSCAGVGSEDEEPLDEGAADVGGCQFLGRMVINRLDVARTGSVLLPPGSVTRQQFSPRCSARP